jgi:hypothetical protein
MMEESQGFDLPGLPWEEIQGRLNEQYVGIVEEEFRDDERIRGLLISMEVSTIKYVSGGDTDEAHEQEEQGRFWESAFGKLNINLHEMLIRDYSIPPDIANATFVVQIGQPNRRPRLIRSSCCAWIDCDGDGTVDTRACG